MAPKLEIGDPAPQFELHQDGGGTLSLASFAGKKLVLYFYPKDDTSGCTMEAIDFNRLKPQFTRAKTEIVGVSPDSCASHEKFKAKHKLGLTLLSDETKADARSLRRLDREEHVWPQIHGRRAHHLAHRAGRQDRADLAQGESAPATPRRCWRRQRRFESRIAERQSGTKSVALPGGRAGRQRTVICV